MWWRRKKPAPLQVHVETLTLRPGDRLLITAPQRLTQEMAQLMAEAVSEWAGVDKGRVLVVVNSRVSVLREGDPPPPPPVAAFPATEYRP